MKKEENLVKILFRFHNNVLDEESVETMWAIVVDRKKGLYKLDNIPFYASMVAPEDIVLAEFDKDEQMLTYRKTIEYSGNSVVQVMLMDGSKDINVIRDVFRALGCQSERVNDVYFSMEIPFSVRYKPVKDLLDELEKKGEIGYAEPCLSEAHRKSLNRL